MTCRAYKTPSGNLVVYCTRNQRGPAHLCDWPLHGAALGRTCDRAARHHVGPNQDLCAAHIREWDRRGQPALADVVRDVARGDWLRRLLERKGLSDDEAAARLRAGTDDVAAWRRGERLSDVTRERLHPVLQLDDVGR